MAELAASIIGIVSAGAKVTLVLSQLAADIGSAGKEARMIGSEIRSFCTIVKTLGQTLGKIEKSQYYSHCTELIGDMTEASLDMFTEILDAAEQLRRMTNGKAGKDGKFGVMERFQWAVFQKPKMILLRAAIEAYKSNLALMLGTLNTAEKVARHDISALTEDILAEEELDQSLLKSLELDQQTSLIELEQAKEEAQQEITQSSHDQAISELTLTPEMERNAGFLSETDPLVHSLRAEIKSLRTSLKGSFNFDTSSIKSRISRQSQRLSLLLETDQKRISQRWSALPVPAPSRATSGLYTSSLEIPSYQGTPHEQPNTDDAFYDRVLNWLINAPVSTRKSRLEALARDSGVDLAPQFTAESKRGAEVAGDEALAAYPSQSQPNPNERQQGYQQAQTDEIVHEIRKQMNLQDQNMQGLPQTVHDQNYYSVQLARRHIEQVPEELAALLGPKVERLALSHNKLTNLSSNFAACSQIRYLNLRFNRFQSVPTAILQLPLLEILDLSRNKIQEIPEQISELTQLRVLQLNKNKIREIPAGLSKLNHLRILLLADNNIRRLPAEIVAMKNSTEVKISGNPLEFLSLKEFEAFESRFLKDGEKDQYMARLDKDGKMIYAKQANEYPLGYRTQTSEIEYQEFLENLPHLSNIPNSSKKLPWKASKKPRYPVVPATGAIDDQEPLLGIPIATTPPMYHVDNTPPSEAGES